jgi:hypothetical protein
VGISDRINLLEFERILRNKIADKPITLSINDEFEIAKPQYLEQLFLRNFVVNLQTLSLKWNRLSDEILPAHADFLIRMLDSVITIFDTGIAVGHFKFKIYFRKGISSDSVYNAYKHIQTQFEPLERKREQSSLEPEVCKIVWELIELLSSVHAQIDGPRFETNSIEIPTAYYTYPYFLFQRTKWRT